MDLIRDIVRRHKAGEPVGVTSVCSAHPLVIEATFRHALRTAQPLALIEATSNQVNQDGGYTGMVPEDFRNFVESIARKTGFPLDRLVLGGDHLGPNAWTALPAAEAMDKAEIMVADYVRAGFRKIHLDCSMSCADDPVPLPERTIAERAARLCRAAEDIFSGEPSEAPAYVIGTEVPVPGGAAEDLEELAVTTPEAAIATVDMHRDLFRDQGLDSAWERVIATVVQPGVEFDHDKVVDYRPERAVALSRAIEPVEHLVFEAHSTDYQTEEALAALVRDHFAILKVGPGVTFALREALWALDAIEAETVAPTDRADLRAVTLVRMEAEPKNWVKYYHATGAALTRQLQYSLSDRIRYYWPDPEIAAAQARLFANLRQAVPPLSLVSQYLPLAYAAVRSGQATLDPAELVMAHVAATLDAYHGACYPDA
ncbi:D-tagatose-bisphosphate aldolase, class II, non-catalytic subunit [Sphingomonas psychrotolerans]|uniref:D-tagatose-bisphosphate aldolase, class II, non-catalytic subunit n=1 Tax=Sphingomonas psychrotolerans TaxID=1327635 RepID=A0ABU3N9T9_9SPHN|nr:D-tagatose-bisphosphate aldolase, class II, non-catalytic subunit [Sphingomonas psychrotolerans]MDT8760276.1 D-tagatose-bisphosphate aldolase, class II, non-catalytic subunit [Sphingomonas psychrotolerans]